jgi:hypothetical protein
MSYQTHFQEAIAAYNNIDQRYLANPGEPGYDSSNNLNMDITSLDNAVFEFSQDNKNQAKYQAVERAFLPISTYYAKLSHVTTNLQKYLKKASSNVAGLQDRLLSEERYGDRVHPAESTQPREVFYGIFPPLRLKAIPYILTAGVFMAVLTLFLIFQMVGLSGQLNLPPAFALWLSTPSTAPPLYKDPMVLGGAAIVFIASTIIFAVLYFGAKKQNTNSQ